MTARRHCRGRAVARRAAAVSKQRLSQAASNSAPVPVRPGRRAAAHPVCAAAMGRCRANLGARSEMQGWRLGTEDGVQRD